MIWWFVMLTPQMMRGLEGHNWHHRDPDLDCRVMSNHMDSGGRIEKRLYDTVDEGSAANLEGKNAEKRLEVAGDYEIVGSLGDTGIVDTLARVRARTIAEGFEVAVVVGKASWDSTRLHSRVAESEDRATRNLFRPILAVLKSHHWTRDMEDPFGEMFAGQSSAALREEL